MDRGTSISPVTLRPRAGSFEEKEQARAREREGLLRERATEAGLSETEAGEKLLAMIRDLLVARLDALIAADPEATGYRNILIAMGHKEDLSRQAVNELQKRYVRR